MSVCSRGSSSDSELSLLYRVDTRWLHSEKRVLKLSESLVPGKKNIIVKIIPIHTTGAM